MSVRAKKTCEMLMLCEARDSIQSSQLVQVQNINK